LLLEGKLVNAGIAQLVEHDLAKVGVASSSLVSRSSLHQLPVPGTRPGNSPRIPHQDAPHRTTPVVLTRLDGRVVMQRTATPCTPVRFRLQPPPLHTRTLYTVQRYPSLT